MKILPVLFAIFLFPSCSPKAKKAEWPLNFGYMPYTNDSNISDEKGNPKRPFVYYSPVNSCYEIIDYYAFYCPLFRDTERIAKCEKTKEAICWQYQIQKGSIKEVTRVVIDSFLLKMLADQLRYMYEPVLSNYFQDETIIRVTHIIGIFGFYSTINLIKTESNIYIETKIAEPGYHSLPDYARPFFDSSIHILLNKRKQMSLSDYQGIDSLLENKKYISLIHPNPICGNTANDDDGWLVEIHKKEGYNYVFRWGHSADSIFMKVIKQLNELSGVDEAEHEANQIYRYKMDRVKIK